MAAFFETENLAPMPAFIFACLGLATKARVIARVTLEFAAKGKIERRDPVTALSSRSMRSISFKRAIFSTLVMLGNSQLQAVASIGLCCA